MTRRIEPFKNDLRQMLNPGDEVVLITTLQRNRAYKLAPITFDEAQKIYS